jgi:fibronectin type 3 domain-containing protein
MTLHKNFCCILLISCILISGFSCLKLIHATKSIVLNNFIDDYNIDGFVSVWYKNQTNCQYISVQFDSSVLRFITGVRLSYCTANLLNPMADCNISYKFESGEYIYYNDVLPNTTGNNRTHAFFCRGDTFLMTNSPFYVDLGCASDDPYIQVGFDNHHSGHSMYSLNGGLWTFDSVEYLMEPIVENVTALGEKTNVSEVITVNNDFIDGYKISLISGDVCHFYVRAATAEKHFNMRFFPLNIKLTSDTNAIWLEEGPTERKSKQYNPMTGDYILLVEPDIDGVDNGTYFFYWTYAPEPPTVNVLPSLDNDGNVELSWRDPTDTDIAYYNIYRGISPDFPTDLAHRISIPGNVTGTTFQDASWLPNGQYFYGVTAVDNTGHESAKSNVINTTVLDSTAPGNPTVLPPQDFPIDNDGIVNLSWTPSMDGDLQSFRLYRAKYAGFPLNSTYLITNLSSTSYPDYILYNGIYFYRVTAVDDNGLESLGSNEVNTTVLDSVNPAPPQNLTWKQRDRQIILNWSKSNALDLQFYYIFRATQPILNISTLNPIANTSRLSWIDLDLPPGLYYYAIIAVDLNERRSSISNTVSITITEPHSEMFLYVLLGILASIGSVIGYALYDRRRTPYIRFRHFNRTNFRNFFKNLGQKLISYIKLKLLKREITTGKDLNLQRKKISHILLKTDSELQAPNFSGTKSSQIPSKPQAALKVEINSSLMKNLQFILKTFHAEKEVELTGLQTQTTLSEQEIQQCLAFLSEHQLIIVIKENKNPNPKYRLSEEFDQKWSQMGQLKLKEKDNPLSVL